MNSLSSIENAVCLQTAEETSLFLYNIYETERSWREKTYGLRISLLSEKNIL